MDPMTIGLIMGGVSNVGNSVLDIGKTLFNKAEAQRNREFQRDMRDTAIISSVNQAEKLGISPSLVLGSGSSSVGGSQASASGGNPMASGLDNLTKILLQDRQLDAQQQLQERQIDAQEKLAHEKAEWDIEKAQAYYNHQQEMAKIRNTAGPTNSDNKKSDSGYIRRDYSKEYLNNLFDNIDEVKI